MSFIPEELLKEIEKHNKKPDKTDHEKAVEEKLDRIVEILEHFYNKLG